MSHKKVQINFMNLGASSLLLIFLVLCIAVFATLTLSSAQSEYSFSRKLAEHKTAYYSASNQSEHLLNELDTILAEAARVSSDSQEFYQFITDTLTDELQGISIQVEAGNDAPILSWQISIDENQALLTKICPVWSYDDASESRSFYRIEAWQTITINQ